MANQKAGGRRLVEIGGDAVAIQLKSKGQLIPPHSDSLPQGERESLDEIATGFALATTLAWRRGSQ